MTYDYTGVTVLRKNSITRSYDVKFTGALKLRQNSGKLAKLQDLKLLEIKCKNDKI